MSKRNYFVCKVFLIHSIILFIWIGYDCLIKKEFDHNLFIAINNTALFFILMKRHKKNYKENESQ